MHGATIKIISAQHARLNNNYKNTKLKLLKMNAQPSDTNPLFELANKTYILPHIT
jgi:hypothetical protein